MGPIGCPETSVRNSRYSLRNNPEEHSSQEILWFFCYLMCTFICWSAIICRKRADIDKTGFEYCATADWLLLPVDPLPSIMLRWWKQHY